MTEKIITGVKHKGTSRNGNPIYTVTLESGEVLRTATDAGVAYEIDNSDYRGVPIVFTLNGHGHITGVEIV